MSAVTSKLTRDSSGLINHSGVEASDRVVPVAVDVEDIIITVMVNDRSCALRSVSRSCTQKYHSWMQDPDIQRLTASEPLSLEEEYEMQQKWRNDADKLTFIILARTAETLPEAIDKEDDRIRTLPMVGDVNLFLSGSFEPARGDDDEEEFTAEAEIMIAETTYRRKGLAREALLLMLQYATGLGAYHFRSSGRNDAYEEKEEARYPSLPNPIPPQSLLCRISEDNEASIGLFEKLGFKITKRVQVFGEVEMRWGR